MIGTRFIACLLVALARTAGAQAGADLFLDVDRLARTAAFDVQLFADDACELQAADLCVGGRGTRRLLRFDVLAGNRGTADLVLGAAPVLAPPHAGTFVYSACHGHYHFDAFARYELRERGTGRVVAPGQKRAFCVQDSLQITSAPSGPRYCCAPECGMRQGVQVGWADLYFAGLACQWIDVTDVAPGDYDLCVVLNPEGLLVEDPAGDAACVPVALAASARPPPRVRLRAPRRGARPRVGRHLRVAWRKRFRGALLFQEVWLSTDGGATWTSLTRLSPLRRRSAIRIPLTPAMATDQARVRVFVCAHHPKNDPSAGAYQCGDAESATFRIVVGD